jgi:hypothetical protein
MALRPTRSQGCCHCAQISGFLKTLDNKARYTRAHEQHDPVKLEAGLRDVEYKMLALAAELDKEATQGEAIADRDMLLLNSHTIATGADLAHRQHNLPTGASAKDLATATAQLRMTHAGLRKLLAFCTRNLKLPSEASQLQDPAKPGQEGQFVTEHIAQEVAVAESSIAQLEQVMLSLERRLDDVQGFETEIEAGLGPGGSMEPSHYWTSVPRMQQVPVS